MTPELFYVLDLGDFLAHYLTHLFSSTLANAVGHVLSFAINGLLWTGLIAFMAAAVSAAI